MTLAAKRFDKVCKLVYAGKDGQAIKEFNTVCPIELEPTKNYKPLRTALRDRKIIIDSDESDTKSQEAREPQEPEEEQIDIVPKAPAEFIDPTDTGWTQNDGLEDDMPPLEPDSPQQEFIHPSNPLPMEYITSSETAEIAKNDLIEKVKEWTETIHSVGNTPDHVKMHADLLREIERYNEWGLRTHRWDHKEFMQFPLTFEYLLEHRAKNKAKEDEWERMRNKIGVGSGNWLQKRKANLMSSKMYEAHREEYFAKITKDRENIKAREERLNTRPMRPAARQQEIESIRKAKEELSNRKFKSRGKEAYIKEYMKKHKE